MRVWHVKLELETAEIESADELRDYLQETLNQNETAYSIKISGEIVVAEMPQRE